MGEATFFCNKAKETVIRTALPRAATAAGFTLTSKRHFNGSIPQLRALFDEYFLSSQPRCDSIRSAYTKTDLSHPRNMILPSM